MESANLRHAHLAKASLNSPLFSMDTFDRWLTSLVETDGCIHTDELFSGARGEGDPSLALLSLGMAVRLAPGASVFSLDLGLRMTETSEPVTLAGLLETPASWPPLLHLMREGEAPWWRIFREPEVKGIDFSPFVTDPQTAERLSAYHGFAVMGWDEEEEAFRRSIIVLPEDCFVTSS